MKLDISRCTHTGLLYVNEVPFTVERIKMVKDVMNYADQNKNQFKYSITITDTAHDEGYSVTIDEDNYQDFLHGVNKYKTSDISSDEDWN